MENILQNITKLNGVHYACLYKDGEPLASNFPDDEDSIRSMAQMIEQVFSALQSIEKSHDEIYFSIKEKLLAAYLMHNSYIAILLTEKKINFPLIHMGIRSASAKIKRQTATAEELLAPSITTTSQETSSPTQQNKKQESPPRTSAHNADLQPYMDKLLEGMVDQLGPAARFVFEDAEIQWRTKYVDSKNNLPYLVEFLMEELDTDTEKREFRQFAEKAIR